MVAGGGTLPVAVGVAVRVDGIPAVRVGVAVRVDGPRVDVAVGVGPVLVGVGVPGGGGGPSSRSTTEPTWMHWVPVAVAGAAAMRRMVLRWFRGGLPVTLSRSGSKRKPHSALASAMTRLHTHTDWLGLRFSRVRCTIILVVETHIWSPLGVSCTR